MIRIKWSTTYVSASLMLFAAMPLRGQSLPPGSEYPSYKQGAKVAELTARRQNVVEQLNAIEQKIAEHQAAVERIEKSGAPLRDNSRYATQKNTPASIELENHLVQIRTGQIERSRLSKILGGFNSNLEAAGVNPLHTSSATRVFEAANRPNFGGGSAKAKPRAGGGAFAILTMVDEKLDRNQKVKALIQDPSSLIVLLNSDPTAGLGAFFSLPPKDQEALLGREGVLKALEEAKVSLAKELKIESLGCKGAPGEAGVWSLVAKVNDQVFDATVKLGTSDDAFGFNVSKIDLRLAGDPRFSASISRNKSVRWTTDRVSSPQTASWLLSEDKIRTGDLSKAASEKEREFLRTAARLQDKLYYLNRPISSKATGSDDPCRTGELMGLMNPKAVGAAVVASDSVGSGPIK